MALFKYFVGSLIISFGVLVVLALVVGATGINVPDEVGRYLLWIWLVLAIILLPFAKKIIRV